ncbi:hypothetical protein D3C72_1925610 [compost metagenome]
MRRRVDRYGVDAGFQKRVETFEAAHLGHPAVRRHASDEGEPGIPSDGRNMLVGGDLSKTDEAQPHGARGSGGQWLSLGTPKV